MEQEDGLDDAISMDIRGCMRDDDSVTRGSHDGDDSLATVTGQARLYFLQHTVYLVIAIFFILLFENDHLFRSTKNAAEGDIYGDYGFYKILFEVVSAYGTVGFSLGAGSASYSFSGSLTAYSQVAICFLMFLGRIRGLTDSIDSSVRNYCKEPQRDCDLNENAKKFSNQSIADTE